MLIFEILSGVFILLVLCPMFSGGSVVSH